MKNFLRKLQKFNENKTVADTCLVGAIFLSILLIILHIPVPNSNMIQENPEIEIILDTDTNNVQKHFEKDSTNVKTDSTDLEKLKKQIEKQTISLKGITVTWYGDKEHGKLTANGEVFSRYKHTTAIDRTYEYLFPMGCKLLVINNDNGKSTIVKVNDRGGFGKHKYASVNPEVVLDLSEAAFKAIGSLEKGKLRNVTIILLEK